MHENQVIIFKKIQISQNNNNNKLFWNFYVATFLLNKVCKNLSKIKSLKLKFFRYYLMFINRLKTIQNMIIDHKAK